MSAVATTTTSSSSPPPPPPPTAAAAAASSSAATATLQLVAKFGKLLIPLDVEPSSTVGDLKRRLGELTNVLPKRQKIFGLKPRKGKLTEAVTMGELKLKKQPHRFMLVGTPEEKASASCRPEGDLNTILDDFDFDYVPSSDDLAKAAENMASLDRVCASTEINLVTPPRPGKKLLVLDLDRTLLHFTQHARGEAEIASLKRPHMDAFLAAVYPEYDLCVWSQTHWRWLEIKLTELGMLTSPKFGISFVLDRTAMFKVRCKPFVSSKDGSKREHHSVKPLELIWRSEAGKKYGWTKANTVHIDDLSRNFAMNPGEGLKIKAFNRKSKRSTNGVNDRELVLLQQYLLGIAKAETFVGIDHSKWRDEVVRRLGRGGGGGGPKG